MKQKTPRRIACEPNINGRNCTLSDVTSKMQRQGDGWTMQC